jgi:hypothetical protein
MHRSSGRLLCFTAATLAVITMAVADSAHAQGTTSPRVEGLIHHYTAALDANGPWQIVGDWSLTLNTATFTVDLLASFSMVRSDTEPRTPHTHHIRMAGGQITPIANGFRINGTAVIQNNGSAAPFSGSPVSVDITGGSGMSFSNVSVTFGGAAAGHFGAEPVLGVVSVVR